MSMTLVRYNKLVDDADRILQYGFSPPGWAGCLSLAHGGWNTGCRQAGCGRGAWLWCSS